MFGRKDDVDSGAQSAPGGNPASERAVPGLAPGAPKETGGEGLVHSL